MDTVITVVVVVLAVGMVVLMFGYAGFIHKGPPKDDHDKSDGGDDAGRSSDSPKE